MILLVVRPLTPARCGEGVGEWKVSEEPAAFAGVTSPASRHKNRLVRCTRCQVLNAALGAGLKSGRLWAPPPFCLVRWALGQESRGSCIHTPRRPAGLDTYPRAMKPRLEHGGDSVLLVIIFICCWLITENFRGSGGCKLAWPFWKAVWWYTSRFLKHLHRIASLLGIYPRKWKHRVVYQAFHHGVLGKLLKMAFFL